MARYGESPVDILLVESDPDDAGQFTAAFAETSANTTIHTATDGESALEFIQQSGEREKAPPPDLIILDLHLPDKSGTEILTTLKGDPKLRRPPVIVMVDEDDEETAKRAYDLSANAFVPKPDNLEEFNEIIDAIVRFWLTAACLPPKP